MQHLVALVPAISGDAWQGAATIFASLIGAVVSIAAVVAANRNARRIVGDQIEADAAHKMKDRVLALRREIYLELADASSNAISYLVQIPSRDPTVENLGAGLAPLNIAAMKAQLVCDFDTYLTIDAYVAACTQTLGKVMVISSRMHESSYELKVREDNISTLTADHVRAKDALSLLLESGREDLQQQHALLVSLKETSEHLHDQHEQRSELFSRRVTLNREIELLTRPDYIELGRIRTRMLVALRGELGDALHRAEIEQLYEINARKAEDFIEALYKDLERENAA